MERSLYSALRIILRLSNFNELCDVMYLLVMCKYRTKWNGHKWSIIEKVMPYLYHFPPTSHSYKRIETHFKIQQNTGEFKADFG